MNVQSISDLVGEVARGCQTSRELDRAVRRQGGVLAVATSKHTYQLTHRVSA